VGLEEGCQFEDKLVSVSIKIIKKKKKMNKQSNKQNIIIKITKNKKKKKKAGLKSKNEKNDTFVTSCGFQPRTTMIVTSCGFQPRTTMIVITLRIRNQQNDQLDCC
jgi:hypothetical protein